jgi:transposase InsO family protein
VFNHSPNIKEITEVIKPLIDKFHPEKILTDNNPFADAWGYWCFQEGVEAVFAHPYYPQDKGKVERAIRNISEELVYLFMNFSKWFNDSCIESWRCWFNDKRYHRGVKDYPSRLFVKLGT